MRADPNLRLSPLSRFPRIRVRLPRPVRLSSFFSIPLGHRRVVCYTAFFRVCLLGSASILVPLYLPLASFPVLPILNLLAARNVRTQAHSTAILQIIPSRRHLYRGESATSLPITPCVNAPSKDVDCSCRFVSGAHGKSPVDLHSRLPESCFPIFPPNNSVLLIGRPPTRLKSIAAGRGTKSRHPGPRIPGFNPRPGTRRPFFSNPSCLPRCGGLLMTNLDG
jgi:hypothetical protein